VVLSQIPETINIFFSLAHEDKDLFEKLRKHLRGLKRRGMIEIWSDSEISAGNNTKDIIKAQMSVANIIVLLLSANFFASDQCAEVEMPYAHEQHALREATVIPVLLRPTIVEGFSLDSSHLLPQNGKAATVWGNLDAALTEIAKGIHQIAEEIASRVVGSHPSMKHPSVPLRTLPYRRNPFFTDREDILETLHRFFASQETPQTQIQALHGLGGIGKTLLATEYVCLYYHEYQAVFWVNATSPEHLSSSILSLADQLGIPAYYNLNEQQRFTAIKHWLQHHDQWLAVLDDLDNIPMMDQFIPLYSNGHVLLTTQSQATGQFAIAVPVDQMTIENGALFLLRRATIIPQEGSLETASEADVLQAMKIAQEFQGYPLALDQAGAYMEENRRIFATYLTLYHQQKATLLDRRGRLASDHLDPVTTTLSMTFQKIAQIDPLALELLYFFAFLHPDALPDEMIMQNASSLDGPLHMLALNPVAFNDALATLQRFSLVHLRTDSTTLNMHSILQVVIKKELTKKQQQQRARQAVRLINATFPEVHFTTWKVCERYVPQAQHCATLIHDFQLTLQEGPLLLERLGFYYFQRGCYTEAEIVLTQALSLQEHHRRGDSADIALTLNSLGLLYQQQARYTEAEALYQRALQLREHLLGSEHSKTVESLHNLAQLYGDLGDYQRAEQLYLSVLSLEERLKGMNHSDVASTLNNLGLMYYHQGYYPQAETVYHRALAIYEHFLPTKHPDMFYPLDGLGALAEIQGQYQRAEALYQQAYVICEQVYGMTHPETAHSINKLADIAESQGNYQQAEALYQQALFVGEHSLGPAHPDTALFLNNLAFLAHRQGQYQRAEDLYQRALSIYEQTLGSNHPDVASVLSNLGQLSRTIKNEERAEKLLRRALAIYEQGSNTTHPDIVQSLSDLSDLLTDQGAYEEAARLLQRALALLLQTPGSEHPDVASIREKHASLLDRMERSEETTQLRQTTQRQEGQQSTEASQNDH
jgi:tetratricopeptide (TPR) repeat protein